MHVLQAVEHQLGAIVGYEVIDQLEHGVQLFVGDVGADAVHYVGGVQVVGEHRVRRAHFGLEGGEEVSHGVGVNVVDLLLAIGLPDAGPGRGQHADGTGLELIGAGGGDAVGVDQLVVNKLLAPLEAIHHAGLQQGIGDLAVADDDLVAQHGVEAAHDGIEHIHALGSGQADGVVQAVLVRIVVGEGISHIIQLLHGGGHLQTQRIQPVLTDGDAVLMLGAIVDLGQGIQLTVHIAGGHFGAAQPGLVVGQLVVQIGGHVLQGFHVHPGDHVVHVGLDHVGGVAAGDAGVNGGVEIVYQHQLHGNAGVFQDLLVDEVVLQVGRPAVAQGADSDFDFDGLVRAGGYHAQRKRHHRYEQQRDEFFHVRFSFLFLICVRILGVKMGW